METRVIDNALLGRAATNEGLCCAGLWSALLCCCVWYGCCLPAPVELHHSGTTQGVGETTV